MRSGQTLVTFLVFVAVAMMVTAAATVVTLVNSRSATTLQQGTLSYYVAESGIENALLRLLRNPYYSGETLLVGEGTAEITVAGDSQKTINSKGSLGNFIRTIQVTTEYNNNVLTIVSWQEVF